MIGPLEPQDGAPLVERPEEMPPLQDALRLAACEICEATGWEVGHSFRRDRRREDAFYATGMWTDAGDARFEALRQAAEAAGGPDDGIVGRVRESAEIVYVGDLAEEADARSAAAREAGLKVGIGVPVFAEQELEAILVFYGSEADEPAEETRRLLLLAARELGRVASHERMQDAVRGAARRTRGLMAELAAARERLVQETERLALLERATGEGAWIWDPESDRLHVSPGARERLGVPDAGTLQEWLAAVHPEDRGRLESGIAELRSGERETLATDVRFGDEEESRSVLIRAAATRAGDTDPKIGGGLSPSGGRAAAGAEPAAALFHPMTGLPLAPLLKDRLEQAIRRRSRQPDELFAVVVVDFEEPREASVWADPRMTADLLLTLGRRLCVAVRPADTVAHSGEREFTLILEGVHSLEAASAVAERIYRDLELPLALGDDEVRVGACMGIVLGRSSYEKPSALLRDARVAVRRARLRGASLQVFDFAAQQYAEKAIQLETDLRAALEKREFFLEYQPIVALDDGRLTGLEALLRWKSAERGLVPPDKFLPIARDSSLIVDIGLWVIDCACRQLRTWQDRLGAGFLPPVAVNLAARQLFDAHFVEHVRDALERNAIPGKWLRFDISEADLMQDAKRAADILSRVQGLGIRIAIDDFGTGYSSLSQLHCFPANALKIDRAFVSRPREKQRKWGVARTIVELGRILGMDVVAEGIETREQFNYLRNLGCQQAQGFFFSGPVSPDGAEKLIQDGYPMDLTAPEV
ncbi:MAG: putative bifunctional diguanylate cyclase/phosphodiesterase [Gemmatimonadota bacterium]